MARSRKIQNRVTSIDVAALAGVSQSTVSRILASPDGASYFNEKTVLRVRDAAAQLGYSPSPIARALRGEGTHLLGLVVREIADPFFATVIEQLHGQARAAGYDMMLGHAHSDAVEGLNMVRALDSRQCDGVFLLGDLKDDLAIMRRLTEAQQPVVALCRGRRFEAMPTVNCDNDLGIRLLLEHLRALGHRRIAFVDGGWIGDIRERLDSFLRYKKALSDTSEYVWLRVERDNWQGGYEAMQHLLAMAPRPTAVMASDDTMAIGILRAAHEAGVRVPDEISVTGFDDIGIASFVTPTLTTVRQPIEEMAQTALHRILDQVKGRDIATDQFFTQIAPQLVIRESTGACAP